MKSDPLHVVIEHLRTRAAELAAAKPTDLVEIRAIVDRIAIDARPLPNVRLVPCAAAAVPGVWVVPEDADPDHRIVYCHGGSFMAGSIHLYAGMVSRLAAAAGACLFFVDFRLAPEHTFPAAHDDCIAAFRWVSKHGPHGRTPAKACYLAGDSVGSSAAVNAALATAGGEGPDGVIVFSPFVDLTLSAGSLVTNASRDPLTTPEAAQACVAAYAPGVDPRDSRLSPLFGELSLLPPIQIHGANLDPLLDDALRLAERARSAGIDAELHVWGNVPHTWYLFPGELPQARAGIEIAAAFVRG